MKTKQSESFKLMNNLLKNLQFLEEDEQEKICLEISEIMINTTKDIVKGDTMKKKRSYTKRNKAVENTQVIGLSKWDRIIEVDGMSIILPLSLLIIPKDSLTYKLCLRAVSYSGWELQHVPEEFITAEICNAAFNNCRSAFIFIPEKFRTPDMYKRYYN